MTTTGRAVATVPRPRQTLQQGLDGAADAGEHDDVGIADGQFGEHLDEVAALHAVGGQADVGELPRRRGGPAFQQVRVHPHGASCRRCATAAPHFHRVSESATTCTSPGPPRMTRGATGDAESRWMRRRIGAHHDRE